METNTCAHCEKKLSAHERSEEARFCIECVWLALRSMRDVIRTIPVIGPLVAIVLEGRVIGLTAVHIEKPKDKLRTYLPMLSMNERIVAKFLRRQGRLLQRSAS